MSHRSSGTSPTGSWLLVAEPPATTGLRAAVANTTRVSDGAATAGTADGSMPPTCRGTVACAADTEPGAAAAGAAVAALLLSSC